MECQNPVAFVGGQIPCDVTKGQTLRTFYAQDLIMGSIELVILYVSLWMWQIECKNPIVLWRSSKVSGIQTFKTLSVIINIAVYWEQEPSQF